MMDSSKIGNGLPVIGQGPDIGISSLPMVGYLGKNYDSAKVTSDGYCPACREKGKLKALKTYRISFQESIFLCEDLQCIYPLGSKSLNNLISPDLEDCHTPNKPQKRKVLENSYKDLSLLANSKKTRTYIVTDDKQILNSEQNGDVSDETSSNLLLGSSQHDSVRTAESLGQNEILEADNVDVATEGPATVDVSRTGGISSQNEGCTSEFEMPWERTCSSFCHTSCVQWRNANALCWLDSILTALVHLEALKNIVTDLCPKDSVFWRLFEKYNQANKLLHTSQSDEVKGGNYKKLTSEISAEIETCLNEIRDEVFTKLQPQLRCTLGERESPVFAFPLLLRTEARVEKLFTYSFSWEFECSQCGHRYQNRCVKNLVTFTNVIPEWHPLNAAHFGPCNSCSSKSQRRKMVLERMSPIFMLHFVEGLPRSDLQHYAFHFEGCLYQITSVIQYQANDHFITWNLHADGSWLECDDLKGLCAQRHEKLEVPASEIHIVIWERKTSQATDEEAACLPLKKTNDQPASSEEKPASPALHSVGQAASAGATSVILPTSLTLAPHTLPQDKAVAHEDCILSDPKVWVDNNILPLTLQGTVWKTASVFQVSTEAFLPENMPVAENKEFVKTNTLQSQKSPVSSSLSAPCKEKLIQAQFMDLSFPLQIVNTNTQLVQLSTEDTAVTQPENNTYVAGLIQGIKSVEVEKDTQLKQSVSWKTEKLEPEQPSISQVSNLKKKATADPHSVTASSSQNQPLKENQKKPFVGSWVKGLLSRGASFMPSCVSAHSRNTVTNLQPSVKGANNFGGFKTKSIKQKTSHVSKKACRSADKSSAFSNPPPGLPLSENTAAHSHTNENAASELLKKRESTSHGAYLNHPSHRRENGTSSANHGDSAEGQIHKLRLKLLKKLKAKKKKLAALMSSPQSETLPSENLEHGPPCESPNDCESIEDLLNELQYQIDIADSKSGCATISSMSSYNNQTHEEILAELLSPTSISTEFSENGETDFRYLEMGDDHIPAPKPTELIDNSQNIQLKQEHNYCSPPKRNQCEVQPVSQINNACVRTLNLESPMKTDIFDEFFSTALTSSANDTLDLPHFDEYLFENY
ncbi:Ubiquitin-specific peptidase-like protein 1 [Heterocephalus glaber]|uniref:SUMO-specific isopeptidase USPL1 isoform X2 n=1 Tax=Heterocephalus glaber TaxID=10181 RepID=G5B267_HETGA|nr:SUMO-specific isopeptidase USPL1 isoform X2 [Heterocephalus glaber]EHB03378.1 Ubiquitin-specific peptidase-like protein 1 [Heterocephalus glaber]